MQAGFWDEIKTFARGLWDQITGIWDLLAGVGEATDEVDEVVGEFQALLAEASLRHAGRSLVAGWTR
jgi:hypothetical protein